MSEWHVLVQIIVEEVDACIQKRDNEAVTLHSLSQKLGYSEFYISRKFTEISGMRFRDYLRQRRLAFALKDVEYVDGKRKYILNQEETTLAQQKQDAIKEAFRNWIFKDPDRRADLCATYNRVFNSNRPREYNGDHIQFAGMNPEYRLEAHQRNAVARMLYGGNALLAHCVGAGKTFEMIAAAMESKRLGLCQKSLFVVPNHFEKIPIFPEQQEIILEDQISEIMRAIAKAKWEKAERWTIKQMERSELNLKAKLERLHDKKKDDVVTFEELGIDRLFVDEAHYYKNLCMYTKMSNVAGISQTEAQKSSDMFAKCRYMDELTPRVRPSLIV